MTMDQMFCLTFFFVAAVCSDASSVVESAKDKLYNTTTTTDDLKVKQQQSRRPLPCDESDNPQICSSGGRIYKLLSYDVDPSLILSECYAACNESYPSEADVAVCKDGCLAEVELSNQRKSKMADFESLFHQAQMQQMMSHWMFEMIAGFDMFNDWYDSSPGAQPEENFSTYVVVEQSNNQLRISSYRVVDRSRVYPVTSHSPPPPNSDSRSLNPYVDSSDEDFEPRRLMRTGYSRLILCLLLLSSGLFLIWLTCSTVSTAPRQRVSHVDPNSGSVDDEKLLLKMKLAYPRAEPAPVHSPSTSNDVKMIMA